MKAYVITRGHAPRMHTAAWLDKTGIEYEVVCDTPDQAGAAADMFTKARKVWQLSKHGVAPGCVNARNFILRELVKTGDWYIGIDDNVQHVDVVDHDLYVEDTLPVATRQAPHPYKSWREAYRQPLGRNVGLALAALRQSCIERGTVYGGFASTENPYFRASKFGYRRFVKTKLYVLHKWCADLQFGGGNYAHDSWMSAFVVAQFGSVVVNNFVHPRYPWYEAGGLGKVRDRRPHLDGVLPRIVAQFPGLVDLARGANSALRFVRTSDASVQRWQQDNGWPRKGCPRW